jgi:hypothetical protein
MRHEERDSDPRVVAYLEALQALDMETCFALRCRYEGDPVVRRFDTVEAQTRKLTSLYVREIQVCRREVCGWRNLADGYSDMVDGVTGLVLSKAKAQVKTGLGQLESVVALRAGGEEIEVPNLGGSNGKAV